MRSGLVNALLLSEHCNCQPRAVTQLPSATLTLTVTLLSEKGCFLLESSSGLLLETHAHLLGFVYREFNHIFKSCFKSSCKELLLYDKILGIIFILQSPLFITLRSDMPVVCCPSQILTGFCSNVIFLPVRFVFSL